MQNITFENFDKLDRLQFANNLTKAIKRFSPLYEGGYVLSLNAPYGSGKTTFLNMWQNSLISQGHEVVYINAWETDFDEEPLVPIISKLLGSLKTSRKAPKAKAAFKEALVAGAMMGNQVFAQVTGANIYEAAAEAQKDNIQKAGQELYTTFTFKVNAYKHLQEQLKLYAENLAQKPLIILIDELDRVRPNYAVKFLEAIKHIFSVPGVCFVLAVDRGQLEKSVRQLYGDIDFENYYLRFITREASLPSEDIRRDKYIPYLWEKYIEEPQTRGALFGFNNQKRSDLLPILISLTGAFKLRPRQIERLFHNFTHLMAIADEKKIASEVWVHAAIMLIAISIDNPTVYSSLGKGEVDSIKLVDYLSKMQEQNGVEFLKTLAISFNTSSEDTSIDNSLKAYAKLRNINLVTANEREKESLLDGLRSMFKHYSFPRERGFKTIYSKLEEWRAFIE